MSLEDELTEELRGTYEAARKRGYIATYFLQMLEEHGEKTSCKTGNTTEANKTRRNGHAQ